MGPTPVYGARAEKPLQNADFAMKQTNICRLSGDIKKNAETEMSSNGTGKSVVMSLKRDCPLYLPNVHI